MARGSKPLSAAQKHEHRQVSLAKYAASNGERLREAARLRMQRNRAALANADDATVRRHKRMARKSASKYRERNRDIIRDADLERRTKRRLSDQHKADELAEPGAAPALASLTMDFGLRAPPERREECRNGCGEWACEGSHPLLCVPAYYPDLGHEDRLEHSKNPEAHFYGVYRGVRLGVFTSRETIEGIVAHDLATLYFTAPTWTRLIELWNLECVDYHDHAHGPQLPPSSPPALLPDLRSPSPVPTDWRQKLTMVALSDDDYRKMEDPDQDEDYNEIEDALRSASLGPGQIQVKQCTPSRLDNGEHVERGWVAMRRERDDGGSSTGSESAHRRSPVNISDFSSDEDAPRSDRHSSASRTAEKGKRGVA
ncbi:hypothetical protein B0H15DRAFT_807652 [Mycena belliarum]|uniref:Uncharacterized protein n=1 Tax=Mycena belliarum TaxID=1033014 RepID=A0AAD6TP47_9AGAR|nr:hypothetical protein B0H15DRAFT_807652 [Mycena belliae]